MLRILLILLFFFFFLNFNFLQDYEVQAGLKNTYFLLKSKLRNHEDIEGRLQEIIDFNKGEFPFPNGWSIKCPDSPASWDEFLRDWTVREAMGPPWIDPAQDNVVNQGPSSFLGAEKDYLLLYCYKNRVMANEEEEKRLEACLDGPYHFAAKQLDHFKNGAVIDYISGESKDPFIARTHPSKYSISDEEYQKNNEVLDIGNIPPELISPEVVTGLTKAGSIDKTLEGLKDLAESKGWPFVEYETTTASFDTVKDIDKSGRLLVQVKDDHCTRSYQYVIPNRKDRSEKLSLGENTPLPLTQFSLIAVCNKDMRTGNELIPPVVFAQDYVRKFNPTKSKVEITTRLKEHGTSDQCAKCHFRGFFKIHLSQQEVEQLPPRERENLDIINSDKLNNSRAVWKSKVSDDSDEYVEQLSRSIFGGPLGPNFGDNSFLNRGGLLNNCAKELSTERKKALANAMNCVKCHPGHELSFPARDRTVEYLIRSYIEGTDHGKDHLMPPSTDLSKQERVLLANCLFAERNGDGISLPSRARSSLLTQSCARPVNRSCFEIMGSPLLQNSMMALTGALFYLMTNVPLQ